MNPIELCFSQLRKLLQRAFKYAQGNLKAAIERALLSVSSSDMRSYFKKCGYMDIEIEEEASASNTERELENIEEGECTAVALACAMFMVLD